MNLSVYTIIEASILATALSLDALVASFAYGSSKIKIPMLSVQIINIICSSILVLSLFIGTILRPYIPSSLTAIICFIILFVLGFIKLMDSIIKSLIKKVNYFNKELKFSMFDIRFILHLYASPEDADIDASRVISSMEAASLAIALSLDGLAVGFGAALGNVNGWVLFFCSLITNTLAVILGCFLGNKVAHKISYQMSWLSGLMLIVLAFAKLR